MRSIITFALLLFFCGMPAQVIHNDVFWDSADGTPIYSQGGGVFKFTDPETGRMAYFWYGSRFHEAERYRNDPSVTLDRNTIVGVSLYKSTDLVHWKDMGLVLTDRDIKGGRPWAGWFARMGVAFIEETGQYALFSQHNNSVMVALADGSCHRRPGKGRIPCRRRAIGTMSHR